MTWSTDEERNQQRSLGIVSANTSPDLQLFIPIYTMSIGSIPVYCCFYGVNAPRRAWFFPRLCSLAVYVFNALADCKMTLPKTRCPTLLLTSCYLDWEGGGGGDDNVPFDCKMTLPKTRCPTLLLTSCYLDREGGWGGWGGMITFLSTVRWRYRRHVAQLCCWRFATLTGRGVGGWGGGGGW